MSLIKCPECEKMFSDKASACPNCACPIDDIVKKETNNNISTNDNLVLCPVCNKQISKYAETCIHCGNPILKNELNKSKEKRLVEFDTLTRRDKDALFEYIKTHNFNDVKLVLILTILNLVLAVPMFIIGMIFGNPFLVILGLFIYAIFFVSTTSVRNNVLKQFYINNPYIKVKKD